MEERQLVYVTMDNANNNISAVELNEWERLQYFGHRLQLKASKTDLKIVKYYNGNIILTAKILVN